MGNKFDSERSNFYKAPPFHSSYNYAGKDFEYGGLFDRECYKEDKDCMRDSAIFRISVAFCVIILFCCAMCYNFRNELELGIHTKKKTNKVKVEKNPEIELTEVEKNPEQKNTVSLASG